MVSFTASHEQFAAAILAQDGPPDTNDPAQMRQGGPFASVALGKSGVATMNIVDDTKKT